MIVRRLCVFCVVVRFLNEAVRRFKNMYFIILRYFLYIHLKYIYFGANYCSADPIFYIIKIKLK